MKKLLIITSLLFTSLTNAEVLNPKILDGIKTFEAALYNEYLISDSPKLLFICRERNDVNVFRAGFSSSGGDSRMNDLVTREKIRCPGDRFEIIAFDK